MATKTKQKKHETVEEGPTSTAVAMLEQIPANLRELLGEEALKTIESLDKVQQLANEVGTVMKNSEAGPIVRTMVRALGLRKLGELLTDEILEDYILPLMNKGQIGFETDRPPGSKAFKRDGAYSLGQVRDFVIAATLSGFPVSGGESMLLAGKFYPRKEGLEQRLREWPGFSEFEWNPVLHPRKSENQPYVKVEVSASWKLDGKPMSIQRGFLVRSNEGMLYDAILGKAKRKTCMAIYERLSGSALPDADDDVRDEKDVTPEEQAKTKDAVIDVDDFRTVEPEATGEPRGASEPSAEPEAPTPSEPKKNGNGDHLATEAEIKKLFEIGETAGLKRMDVIGFALNVAAEHKVKIDKVDDLPRALVLEVKKALEIAGRNSK